MKSSTYRLEKVYLAVSDSGRPEIVITQGVADKYLKIYGQGNNMSGNGDPKAVMDNVIAEFTIDEFLESVVGGYLEADGRKFSDFAIPF